MGTVGGGVLGNIGDAGIGTTGEVDTGCITGAITVVGGLLTTGVEPTGLVADGVPSCTEVIDSWPVLVRR